MTVVKEGENIFEECDKVLLNTGAGTQVFCGGESHLDLAFSSPGVANMTSWEMLDYSCGSDQTELQSHIQYEEIYIIQGECLKEQIGKGFLRSVM